MKSLWASVQGDPVFMRRVNGWLTIFWLLMIPVSIATGWISSVAYVATLSLWRSSPGTGQRGKRLGSKSIKRRKLTDETRLTFLVRPLTGSLRRQT
jgi:hypothetical protein